MDDVCTLTHRNHGVFTSENLKSLCPLYTANVPKKEYKPKSKTSIFDHPIIFANPAQSIAADAETTKFK